MSGFARIYKAPTMANVNNNNLLYSVKTVISYDYTKHFSYPGEFTISFPLTKELLAVCVADNVIMYDGDTLIIEDISYDTADEILTVKGTDGKGLLSRRITAPYDDDWGETYGYDVFEGTTADCIVTLINHNLMLTPDTERSYDLSINRNGVTGITDKYMTKLDYLSDIVRNLCDNAGTGYEIYYDCEGLAPSWLLEMKLIAGVDRSMQQSAIPRVIFSPGSRNASELSFETCSSNLKNAIYATGAGVTSCVYRDSSVPSGFSRRECAIDVSTDTVADVPILALEAVKDNIKTSSFSVVPISGYGTEYNIGDFVSVRDPYGNRIYSGQITTVEKSYSGDSKNLSITLGTGKPKFLNKIINNLINKTQQRR